MRYAFILIICLATASAFSQDSTKQNYPLIILDRCMRCPVKTHKVWNHWLWPFDFADAPATESGREYRQHQRKYNQWKRRQKYPIGIVKK